MNLRHGFLLTAIVSLTLPSVVRAADSEDFTLTVTPYAWIAGVSGDITTRGVTSSVDKSFTEILDDTDSVLGLAGRAEARKGRFGLFVDGVYVRLGVDDLAPRLGGTDVLFEQWVIDFGLLYRLGEWPLGGGDAQDGGRSRLTLDATLGGRYMHVGTEIDFANLPTRKQNRDWLDPTIGAQSELDLSRHWGLLFRGDVGGFGAASDFTWSAAGYVARRFELGGDAEGSVFAGYKAIGTDYQAGSGINEFGWDAVLHGPVIGVSFRF